MVGKVLNRVIRRGPNRWELEDDIRHAEILAQHIGETCLRKVATPDKTGGLASQQRWRGCASVARTRG